VEKPKKDYFALKSKAVNHFSQCGYCSNFLFWVYRCRVIIQLLSLSLSLTLPHRIGADAAASADAAATAVALSILSHSSALPPSFTVQ